MNTFDLPEKAHGTFAFRAKQVLMNMYRVHNQREAEKRSFCMGI